MGLVLELGGEQLVQAAGKLGESRAQIGSIRCARAGPDPDVFADGAAAAEQDTVDKPVRPSRATSTTFGGTAVTPWSLGTRVSASRKGCRG